MTDAEKQAAPASLAGAVSGTDSSGNQITVSYAGELVLDTTLPFRVVAKSVKHMAEASSEWPKLPGADEFARRLEAIQLAVLFTEAGPAGVFLTARPVWAWIAAPVTHGRTMRIWDVHSGPGFMPYRLGASERDELGSWIGRVDDERPPSIDIAIRRVIAAAQERTDSADRLVDAVIAWENLFGTSEGEPRFRITAAMAWLLEPGSVAKREALQIRLKTLYDARSKIVHGGRVDGSVIAQQANEAFAFSVQALAALFRDRADILALSDGPSRSLRLTLAGLGDSCSDEANADSPANNADPEDPAD